MLIEFTGGTKSSGHGRLRWELAFVILCAIALGMLGLWRWDNGGKSRLDFSEQQQSAIAEAQAYSAHIHFSDIQMSRAENFLHQEITYISGVVSNNGPRDILSLDVTADFRDFSGASVLRERRALFGGHGVRLGPGQQRDFQLAFESVPETWNQNYPEIKTAALRLP